MEFGATHCMPANPACMFCTFHYDCVANATGKQSFLPVKSKKVKVKNRFFNYFVIEKDKYFLMHQRADGDIWSGLYDFYLVESEEKLITLDEISLEKNDFLQEILSKSIIKNVSESFKHILTHQRIEAKFWHIILNDEVVLPENYHFYSLEEIEDLPKPILIEKHYKSLNFLP